MARLPCAPREFSALPQELRELTGQWMSGSGTNTLDYVDCLFWMQRCRSPYILIYGRGKPLAQGTLCWEALNEGRREIEADDRTSGRAEPHP